MASSNTPYLAGISLCLLLGVGDLVLLNTWWAPQLWPPGPGAQVAAPVAAAPRSDLDAAVTARTGGDTISVATVLPQPTAPAAAAVPVAAAPVVADADAAAASAPAAPVAVEAPAPAAPVAVEAPAPATPSITFGTNSHTLNPASRSALAGLVAWLRKNRKQKITIAGHADQRGDSLSNQALSLRRARSVARFFWSRGVKRGQVHYRGYGASRPVDGRDDPAAWEKNRRVNIQIQRDDP